jgi:diaminopimelate epimerase
MLPIWKAHAYGNDFLCVRQAALEGRVDDLPALALALCARHTGVGADGLIVFDDRNESVTMRLLNADGSPAEVSGNGVRCLAAIVATERGLGDRRTLRIRTDAGVKTLALLASDRAAGRFQFRADMGAAEDVRESTLDVAGERVRAVTMRMGNPQCVVLSSALSVDRLHWLGPALQKHAAFPDGVNVELAVVETPQRVRILIWERGVGPTQSSGTGSCASAVAAAAVGRVERAVDVESPGGTQHVEWLPDGTVALTGWAQIVLRGEWLS